MVAARIQGPAFARQGIPAHPDRITTSSHGGFIQAVDAFGGSGDSELWNILCAEHLLRKWVGVELLLDLLLPYRD